MAGPIDDARTTTAAPAEAGGATEAAPSSLTREQIDEAFPPGSPERDTAFARARAASTAPKASSFYAVVQSLPIAMQQALLDARHEGISRFLNAWAESIAEQAELDEAAALIAQQKAMRLAQTQRSRENLGIDEATALDEVIERLETIGEQLSEVELPLRDTREASFRSPEAPADRRHAGLERPGGGVRLRTRHL